MNGIWNAESAQHHQSSLKFAKWLAKYLPKRTAVIDFGCGNGYYVKYLLKECFGAVGVDGNADIDLKYPNFVKADLSEKFTTDDEYSIISLEVGEHIPKEGQEQFMQNLTNNCHKHLILSWASIGQPGIGHINCRDQKEVIADVESRGFKLNEAATKEARANVDKNCDWLERNLLVFEKI